MSRSYTYVSAANELYDHLLNEGEGFDDHDTTFEMYPKRDLKIASFDDYFNAVAKVYGKDLGIKVSSLNGSVKFKNTDVKLRDIPQKYTDGMFGTSQEFDKIIRELKRSGFDGAVDPIDGLIQYEQAFDKDQHNKVTAMLVFNPGKNLRIVDKYR